MILIILHTDNQSVNQYMPARTLYLTHAHAHTHTQLVLLASKLFYHIKKNMPTFIIQNDNTHLACYKFLIFFLITVFI